MGNLVQVSSMIVAIAVGKPHSLFSGEHQECRIRLLVATKKRLASNYGSV